MKKRPNVTPFSILKCLPTAYNIMLFYGIIATIVNLSIMIAYHYFNSVFQSWILMSDPIVALVSVYTDILSAVTQGLVGRGLADEIKEVRSIISIDFILYVFFQFLCLAAVARDFPRYSDKLNVLILGKMAELNWNIQRVLVIYAIFSIVSIYIIYTGSIYIYPVSLYSEDSRILLSVGYFCLGISFISALLALILLRWHLAKSVRDGCK